MSDIKERILHPERFLPNPQHPPLRDRVIVPTNVPILYPSASTGGWPDPDLWPDFEQIITETYNRQRWGYFRTVKRKTLAKKGLRAGTIMKRRATRLLERALRQLPEGSVYAVEFELPKSLDTTNDQFMSDHVSIGLWVEVWVTPRAFQMLCGQKLC